MDVKKICILGAGAMGHGIAQVCATAGYEVWVKDVKQEFLDRGKRVLKRTYRKQYQREK